LQGYTSYVACTPTSVRFFILYKKLYIQVFSMIQDYFGLDSTKIQGLLSLDVARAPRIYWVIATCVIGLPTHMQAA
jgi:hypothetical protein